MRIGGPLVILLGAVALWLAVDREIVNEQASLDRTMAATVQSMASDYAKYLNRSIDAMDQVTMHLKYDWERSRGQLQLKELVERGLFTSSQFVDVAIANRHGEIVTATTSSHIRHSVAGQDFFQWHKSNISSALRVSALDGNTLSAGKGTVKFTRRLDTAVDDFDGVVILSVDPGYFLAFYDRTSLGQRGLLAVVGGDGEVRAARIGAQDDNAASPVLNRVPRFGVLNDGETFHMNGERWLAPHWFADADTRLVAWRPLAAYPLTVMVGLSEVEQLVPARKRWEGFRKARWYAEGVLLLLMVLLVHVGARMAKAKRIRTSVNTAYRLATEVGDEAFYMLSPLHAPNGSVIDFQILDCNERGAGFFGLTKSLFIGRTLSSIYTEAESARLMSIYRKAFGAGTYREEVAFHGIGNSGIRWIRRKIVCSGEELAVTLRDISLAKEQEGELIRLANTDELTGLANRSSFIRSLESTISDAARASAEVALLFIDLDKFKNVNDALGHSLGDKVLKQAADRLRAALRPSDHVARLGGDEFTAILQQYGSNAELLRVAERILHALAQPYHVGNTSVETMDIGASIGIGIYPRDGDTAETLLKHADIAMYSAKANGRGTYCFYRQELYDALCRRMNIERELAEAIHADQFELYFQPRIDARSGKLVSFEALVRWRHPKRGIVPPLEFIPIAESNGQIAKIGAIVIRKACDQIAHWQSQGHAAVPVSVNVSAVQFQHGDVGNILTAALQRSDISPELVELEITESAMLGEHSAIISRLGAIRELGVKLAVDDFGTGYSSLSQLQKLDMDVLKVDRMFTAELETSHESRILYRAIVSMAHALDMHIVAEGVETWGQANILREIGCDELQGYLISRPVPADEAEAFLQQDFRFPSLSSAQQGAARTYLIN